MLHKRGVYWWLTGKHDGKIILMGPYNSDQEAEDMGFESFKEETYEKHILTTRDRATAAQNLKHKLLAETHDLSTAMKPFQHGVKP